MISRRILRIKVLQVAYAHFLSDKKWEDSEKELEHSIHKGNDLLFYFIQLLIELQVYHQQRITLAMQKKIPLEEDLDPSFHFVNNSVLEVLKNNIQFQKKQNTLHYSWVQYPELKKKIWGQVLLLPEFQEYLNKEKVSFEDDKEILKHIVRKVFYENDEIFYFLLDQSIYWNVEIEFVLSIVVKVIKSLDQESGMSQSLTDISVIKEDVLFAKKLLVSTLQNYSEHNIIIDEYTKNWEIERIAFMDILIMHIAINEILEFPAIPKKVSMNEYIELAKFFSTNNSSNFINGILDKVIARYEQENKIIKTGRGLKNN